MTRSIGVVIPSYNHAAFVGEAVQSVLDQSFQDFDILFTDDGSRDETPDIIRKFSDPRVKLEIFPENRGEALAGNSAIRRSSTRYIARLNADDFFLPRKLENQFAFLESNPVVAAVFGMPRLIDERGAPLGGGYREFTFPFSKAHPSREDWLRHFFFSGNCLCHSTVMIRRSILDEIGLFDPRLTNLSDFDLWVRLCMTHDIHVMQAELTAFRKLDNDRNISAPRRDSLLRSQFEFSRILKHYRAMSADLLCRVFGNKAATKEIRSHNLWLVELALSADSPAHRFFALETLFEAAQSDTSLHRMHDLSGSVDLFGFDKDTQIAELKHALWRREKSIETIFQSRSWRYTAPARWVRRLGMGVETGRQGPAIQADLKQPPLAIIATYNELDIFPQILLRLLNDGIHVHVMDNWSCDGTYETVKEIASDWRGALTVERFPDAAPIPYFDLRSILRRKEAIAAQWPGRWIISQDSDEIRCSPWSTVSLHEG